MLWKTIWLATVLACCGLWRRLPESSAFSHGGVGNQLQLASGRLYEQLFSCGRNRAAGNAKTTPPSVAAAAAPAAETVGGHHSPPVPVPATPPWPEQYHAVVITNQTARGGQLQQIDIYYDWPRGRGLNVIRDQLDSVGSEPQPLRDVQWANGTSFLFDSASCTTFQYPVGLLPPDWKARGGTAAYLGRDRVDGFDCHVWSDFVFEDVATGRTVSWSVVNGTGMERHVLSFEVWGVPQDPTKWQAPPYCFNGSRADGGAASP